MGVDNRDSKENLVNSLLLGGNNHQIVIEEQNLQFNKHKQVVGLRAESLSILFPRKETVSRFPEFSCVSHLADQLEYVDPVSLLLHGCSFPSGDCRDIIHRV